MGAGPAKLIASSVTRALYSAEATSRCAKMELKVEDEQDFFTPVLLLFLATTGLLWWYSLLGFKGWFAAFVAFCGLIYFQRQQVLRARDLEREELQKQFEALQKIHASSCLTKDSCKLSMG